MVWVGKRSGIGVLSGGSSPKRHNSMVRKRAVAIGALAAFVFLSVWQMPIREKLEKIAIATPKPVERR